MFIFHLQPGDAFVTSGPDVLTSCSYRYRMLTLGVEYVVGIGGFCSPIGQWSTLASYSDSEVALLESLQQCSENPSSCNGTIDTVATTVHVMATHTTTNMATGTSAIMPTDTTTILPAVTTTVMATDTATIVMETSATETVKMAITLYFVCILLTFLLH